MSATTTFSLEVFADGSTYGDIIDFELNAGAVAATIDLRTPSSASTPLLTLTVPNDKLEAFAQAAGWPSWAAFVGENQPEFIDA